MMKNSESAATSGTTETKVWLEGVTKLYGSVVALSEIDLEVLDGEFLTLLGPSGSGKTTVLNLIAGMVVPTAGRIWIDGRDITDLAPNKRGLGMVFQNYALMPHMTVFENVAFPLRVRKLAMGEAVKVMVRPENVSMLAEGEASELANQLPARAVDTISFGGVIKSYVRLADGETMVVQELTKAGRTAPAEGTPVTVAWAAEDTLVLPLKGSLPES